MWACFVLIFCVAVSQGNYVDNPSAEGVYGTHTMIYTWPTISQSASKCNKVIYSKPGEEIDLTCNCERESANLALIQQELFSFKYILLADIVDEEKDLQSALDDKCSCSPLAKSRDVIFKVNDDYFLQYESGAESRVYLFGKKVPTADELTELIDGFSDLKDREGSLMCQEEEGGEAEE